MTILSIILFTAYYVCFKQACIPWLSADFRFFFFNWGGIFSLCATSKRIPISKRELIIIRYILLTCAWIHFKYHVVNWIGVLVNTKFMVSFVFTPTQQIYNATKKKTPKNRPYLWTFTFLVSLSEIKLQISFVMYLPIHFINDFMVLKRTMTENYISISNKKSFFEYCMYEMIKYGRGWSNLS